jgi:uncharacterized protein YqjF (DUF2071 family)
MTPFLTAEWKHLLNITYRVPPELLLDRIPPGVELDIQDGSAFASVVAFDFLDTRVRGIKIPFHVNFPEINLRYYIKYQGKRGVMFWKELVPKYCIALVARKIYNEPYEAIAMKSSIELLQEGSQRLEHIFSYNQKECRIEATFKEEKTLPGADTLTHYFKEHDLGVGVSHSGEAIQYEVRHPEWNVFDLIDYKLEMDFGHVYGEQWAFLADETPYCACLAEGSEVAVYPYEKL